VAEALRWIGLSRLAEGRIEDGRRALEQSIELLPRNRSRRSYEALVRDRAAMHDHVYLADLRAAADRGAPDGLAGPEVFLDYCHMNWRGYGRMADELFAAMHREGLLPAFVDPDLQPPDIEAQAGLFGLGERELHPPSEQ
jgi:hypothetical protein